ncbi:MAG: hypothetical protein IJK96_05190 [Bacteroidales bacterium]|nr:hypothetical protein [Bacteroidales bacterium]
MSNNNIVYTNVPSGETGQKVVEYFTNKGGCLGKETISDEQYEMMVATKVQSSFNKEKALEVLGIDESQVQEIPPICLHSYSYSIPVNGVQILSVQGKDKEWRSSAYQVTWIFFSDHEIYFYREIFCMDCNASWAMTDEFFYEDVVNFYTTKETLWGEIKQVAFSIVVPEETKTVYLDMTERNLAAIEGMKQKLREKKIKQG